MMHGIQEWELSESTGKLPTHPFRESIQPEEIVLSHALLDQTTIGWDQLLRGRISLQWTQAYQLLSGQVASSQSLWSKTVILHLWTYSISLWKFRNGVVHGHTSNEAKQREFDTLHSQVRAELAAYRTDKFIVSPEFSFLYTRKTEEERMLMDRDSLAAWLRSIKAAKTHHQILQQTLPTIKEISATL
jgi:hypothetical protein